MATPTEYFSGKIKEHFEANPDTVKGLEALYQFDLDGESFYIVCDGMRASCGAGAVNHPQCTITMTADDFMNMIDGDLNPTTAFMTQKIKVNGDIGLALKLQAVLP